MYSPFSREQREERNESVTDRTRSAEVVVVGAGHNGLVAACYLAKAGLDVLVVERWETPGGMTATNPMAPEAPDHLINEASIHASLFRTTNIDAELQLSAKYGLRQRVIDPAHVHINQDGESIAMWRDPMRTVDEIRRFSRRDADRWIQLSNIIARATAIGLPMMQTNPTRPEFGNVLEAVKAVFAGRRELKEIIRWVSISQREAIEEYFEHPMVRGPLTVNLPFMHFDADLSGWALIYLGVLQKWGVAMFEGGTGAFPAALIRCLEAHGGRVRCSAPVEQLIVRGGRVAGVRLEDGEEVRATRAVVTACGPSIVLNRMLPAGLLPEKLQHAAANIPTSSTGYGNTKINVALSGKVSLPRHQEWRARQLPGDPVDLRLPCVTWSTHEQSLRAGEQCVRGEVPEMIPGLSQVTTAFDPKMAPEGNDTWWFWSGLVPSKPNEDWDTVRTKIERRVLADCAQYYEGLDSLEIARRTLTPHDIETRFGAPDGNVYHVDPIVTRFGPARPAMGLGGYKTPVPGLYLSGSGTHPIAGINGMPGMNAARTAIRQLAREGSGAASRSPTTRLAPGATNGRAPAERVPESAVR
jgi:phytoene dehydrogenase-like protein